MWEERAPNNIHGNDRPNTIVISKNGLSAKEKAKLNSIEEGAQVNKIEHLTIDGKVAKVDAETKTVLVDLVSTDRVDREVNTLNNAISDEAIERNRVDQEIIDGTNAEIKRLDKRIDDVEEKHSEDVEAERERAEAAEAVLAEDLNAEVRRATNKELELYADIVNAENKLRQAINAETACREEDVNRLSDEISDLDRHLADVKNDLDIEVNRAKEVEETKVDKVEGKSLVDNAEIEKLATVSENAQENKIEVIKLNDEVVEIVDKQVDLGKIATSEALEELDEKVEVIKGDYLKAADKDELHDYISEEKERATRAETDEKSRAITEETRLDEKIDDKFAELNIENGTGLNSLIQKGDIQEFTVNNPNATNNGETVAAESNGVKSTVVFNGSSRATGSRAFAANSKTQAIGDRSATFGNQTVAEGVNSFAVGNQTTTKGAAAFASGAETFAKGDASFVTGYGTVAAEFGSAAFGNHTSANGLTSFVIGNGNYANGKQSFAGGNNSVADYENDFVFGESLCNNYENQAVFGRFNDNSDWSNPRPLFMIGNGTDNEHRSNAFKVYADGHAEVQAQGNTDNSVVIKSTLYTKADLVDGIVPDYELPDYADILYYHKEQQVNSETNLRNILSNMQIGEVLWASNSRSVAMQSEENLPENDVRAANIFGWTFYKKVNENNDYETIQPKENALYIYVLSSSQNRAKRWTGSGLALAFGSVINTARDNAQSTQTSVGTAYAASFGVQNANDIVKLQKLFEAGEGENSIQQKQSSKEFEFDNPNYTPSIEVKFGAFGKDSAVLNGNSMAYGSLSTAEGRSTLAIGDRSHSEGTKTVAANNNAHAEGLQSVASGDHSHAEGCLTFARGLASHAEGNKTYAALGQAHAEGLETQATNYQAHAEGTKTIASGVNAHAEGDSTKAVGGNSHSEGVKTNASGDLSHVEGYGTYTGVKPQEGGSSGSGTSSPTTPEQDGYDLVENSGFASHAEGVNNSAIGNYSHAEGYGTKALFGGSHAEGNKTITGRAFQHVCGVYNKENPNALFVIGNGDNETARTNALEVYKDGHAELQTQGTSNNSIVIKGYLEQYLTQNYTTNLRTGDGAKSVVSYGGTPSATGNFALALGYSNNAAGEASAALGYKTKTTNRGQLSVGVNNKNDAGALFDVGNGDVSGTASSAFTVYQDGLVVIPNGAKGIKIGNTILDEEKLNKLIALLDTMEAE